MANWWEWLSPAVQGIGGVLELLGLLFLAIEWQVAMKASDADTETKKLRFRAYSEGFALIVFGVVLQISANGIAWAGARGLLN